MSKVELSLSETFHRHKRNLVLLCSAILVLRIASPATLKLPFVGTDDVSLPAQTAFILLGLALVYMFSQYYIEYRTMLARHSSKIIGTPKQSVDEVIDGHLKAMTDWVVLTQSVPRTDINGGVTAFSEKLSEQGLRDITGGFISNFESNLNNAKSSMIARIGPDPAALTQERIDMAFADAKRHIDSAMDQAKSAREHSIRLITSQLDDIQARQSFVEEKLAEYSATYRDIAGEFRRLSSNIGSAQRVGFTWIDGYLVIVFALCGLASCITGALGWWIKAAAPVAAAVTGK